MRRRAERGPGQVADRVHRDLRVVGAGLDDEVAVGARGVEVVGREVREVDEPVGQPVREAEPVDGPRRPGPTNSDRPKPNVIVRPAGGQVHRLARVVGRRVVRPDGGPNGPADRPCGEPRRDRRPAPQELDQLVARRRREVERREVQPVLRGRDDAGLVHARERVRPQRAVDAAEGSPVSAPTSSDADGREAPEPDAAAPPAARRGRRGARRGAVRLVRSRGCGLRSPGAGDRRR